MWREGILNPTRVLHGDQVRPLKGATAQALLGRLGITASFSRPRVSDDNAYAEALFRTLKYSPGFPRQGFVTLTAARDWVQAFADGYNTVHRHRSIQPACRRQVCHAAAATQRRGRGHPARVPCAVSSGTTPTSDPLVPEPAEGWSGDTRNWSHIREVWLNPENDRALTTKAA